MDRPARLDELLTHHTAFPSHCSAVLRFKSYPVVLPHWQQFYLLRVYSWSSNWHAEALRMQPMQTATQEDGTKDLCALFFFPLSIPWRVTFQLHLISSSCSLLRYNLVWALWDAGGPRGPLGQLTHTLVQRPPGRHWGWWRDSAGEGESYCERPPALQDALSLHGRWAAKGYSLLRRAASFLSLVRKETCDKKLRGHQTNSTPGAQHETVLTFRDTSHVNDLLLLFFFV